MAGEGAAGAELGLRPSEPDPRWRPHWDTGQSWVQRWPSSGSQSGSRGLGLGLVPLATELVPEPKEGPSLSEGPRSRQRALSPAQVASAPWNSFP